MNVNSEQTMVVSTVKQYINRFNNVDTDCVKGHVPERPEVISCSSMA